MGNESTEIQVREVVGIFFDVDKLEAAVKDLKASGFHQRDIGLLAGKFTVREKLGHVFKEVNEAEGDENGVQTAFVVRESMNDTPHALIGTLYMVGAAVAGGAVVASAGILGGAVGAAVGSMAVFTGIGALLGSIIHESEADYLEEQVDEGHLVLFVRVADADNEAQALEILGRDSAFSPKVYTVPRHHRR